MTEVAVHSLLKNVDILKNKQQLARGKVAGLNCKYMIKQLKLIGDSKSKENSISSVKGESALETKGYNRTIKQIDSCY